MKNKIGTLFLNIIYYSQLYLSKLAYFLGPVCVLVAVGCMLGMNYVFFTTVLPFYLNEYFSLFNLFHLCLFIFFSFNMWYNFYYSYITSPGYVTREIIKEVVEISTNNKETTVPYCHTCKNIKPARAHHCSVCNRCVMRMDHHCPWIAGCVGFYNYKYFILYLIYGPLTTIYICLITNYPIEISNILFVTVPYISNTILAMFLLFVATIAAGSSVMAIYHLYLVSSQQTTIEFYQRLTKGKSKNPFVQKSEYSMGLRKNFEYVFGEGSFPIRWIFPSSTPTSFSPVIPYPKSSL